MFAAYLCLWIDFGAVFFEDFSNCDLVFLSAEVHWRQTVLRSAVGVSSVVE